MTDPSVNGATRGVAIMMIHSLGRSVGSRVVALMIQWLCCPGWTPGGPLGMTGRWMSVDLRVTSSSHAGRRVVQVSGEIDLYTAGMLRDRIGEAILAGPRNLVIDLEQVRFMDSTGLGVLVGGLNRVQQNQGSLSLVCSQERILKVFRITGLTSVFRIHSSLDDALMFAPGV